MQDCDEQRVAIRAWFVRSFRPEATGYRLHSVAHVIPYIICAIASFTTALHLMTRLYHGSEELSRVQNRFCDVFFEISISGEVSIDIEIIRKTAPTGAVFLFWFDLLGVIRDPIDCFGFALSPAKRFGLRQSGTSVQGCFALFAPRANNAKHKEAARQSPKHNRSAEFGINPSSVDHVCFGDLFRVAMLPIGLRQRGTFTLDRSSAKDLFERLLIVFDRSRFCQRFVNAKLRCCMLILGAKIGRNHDDRQIGS